MNRPAWIVLLLLTWPMRPGAAQLISPGKLAEAHAELEGIRNCTRCHELRRSGASSGRCLACHEPLARRIEADRGYHAKVDGDCASCHKEHFGRDFALVRLDTLDFDHGAATGYALEGAHTSLVCGECHAPERITDATVVAFKEPHGALARTRLGLPGECAGCHATEDPHGGQFEGRDCADCHRQDRWEGASTFDHGATGFPLRGAHAAAECAVCHGTPGGEADAAVRYAGVRHESCQTCHAADDPHDRQFGGQTCAGCHDEGRWEGAGRFDHARSRYPLTGVHRDVACASCHAAGGARAAGSTVVYRPLEHDDCVSCHEAEHEGAMEGRCAACHRTRGWSAVDRSRVEDGFDHARTGFELVGAHAGAACAACHDPGAAGKTADLTLRFAEDAGRRAFPAPAHEACAACHDDRHDGVFAASPSAGACDACHTEGGWIPSAFDLVRHDREVAFALDGAHRVVPCAGCHLPGPEGLPVFDLGEPDCRDCHAPADPHGRQFDGRPCAECHSVEGFTIPDFDHGRTRFPLDGAHRDTACSACHPAEPDALGRPNVRYLPTGTECRDCHGGAP